MGVCVIERFFSTGVRNTHQKETVNHAAASAVVVYSPPVAAAMAVVMVVVAVAAAKSCRCVMLRVNFL
jgi:hypothetical protein